MSDEHLKKLIDGILDEKKKQLESKIDQFGTDIIKQLDSLKQLNDIKEFKIPDSFVDVGQETVGNNKLDTIHSYVKKLSGSANQLKLINNMLEGIKEFCSRAALFLVRDDKLVGWRGIGFSGKEGEISNDELKRVFFSLSANIILKQVLDTKEAYSGDPITLQDDFLIYHRFGGKKPLKILVLPFFVKGKPQAVIYADSIDGEDINQKVIEIISTVGEMSLDLLPVKQKLISRVKTKELADMVEEVDVTSPEEFEKTARSAKDSDPKRLAKVIINDIILYNKNLVEEGLKKSNLFEPLRETLLQAREMYLQKFGDISIFEELLVSLLAKGEKTALKGYPFEVHK